MYQGALYLAERFNDPSPGRHDLTPPNDNNGGLCDTSLSLGKANIIYFYKFISILPNYLTVSKSVLVNRFYESQVKTWLLPVKT